MDSQLFFAAKILVILAMLASFLVYQNTMFRSIDKLSDKIMAKSDRQFQYEGQDSNEVEKSQGAAFFYLGRLIMLAFVLLLSMKLPQNIELLLEVSGGLLCTTLSILFPILIFNKTFRHSG